MIHVVAFITTQEGKRAEVLKEFAQIVPIVHAEQGCIEYQPVVDVAEGGAIQTHIGPDSFIVVEKWATLEDLTIHASAEHMQVYASKVSGLITDRRVHVLNNA